MRVREAKDFLVQQAVQQAALESVPLSDLEKRMMYFTEGPDATEDAVKLSEEFDAAYDMDEYEAKISGLLHSARDRTQKESHESGRLWNEAIKTLGKGDHYLSVLWDPPELQNERTEKRPPYDSVKLFIAGMILTAFIAGLALLLDRFGIVWKNDPTEPSNWILRALMISLLVGAGGLLAKFLGGSSRPGSGD